MDENTANDIASDIMTGFLAQMEGHERIAVELYKEAIETIDKNINGVDKKEIKDVSIRLSNGLKKVVENIEKKNEPVATKDPKDTKDLIIIKKSDLVPTLWFVIIMVVCFAAIFQIILINNDDTNAVNALSTTIMLLLTVAAVVSFCICGLQ